MRLGGVRLRTNEAMANRSLRWLSGRGKTSAPASQSRQCRCLPVVNSPQSLFRTNSSPRRAVGGKSMRGPAGHKLMSPYVITPLGRRSRRHLTVAAIPSRIPSEQLLDVKPLPLKGGPQLPAALQTSRRSGWLQHRRPCDRSGLAVERCAPTPKTWTPANGPRLHIVECCQGALPP